MVCIYCGSKTKVNNSRLNKKSNQVWRRRQCLSCKALFTTDEIVNYRGALSVRRGNGHLEPFERDKLFVSIYFSCGHLKDAVGNANALTSTVITKLAKQKHLAAINTEDLVQTTLETLKRFNKSAAAQYSAYHL